MSEAGQGEEQEQKQKLEHDEDELLDGGKVMPLLDHLAELRRRVIISLIAAVCGFLLSLCFATEIINYLKVPLAAALKTKDGLHFTGPLDVFLTNIRVSILSGIVLSSPVWMHQLWGFIRPVLYERERRLILPFTVSSVLLFFCGLAFCFYLILPMALDFLIELGREVSTPMITITDYVSLLSVMVFGFGVVFEVPLILIMLSLLGLLDSETLAKCRRYIIVGVLVVAAILTPPDPLSQVGMAIPLYLMYEGAILVIRSLEKKKVMETAE